MDFSLCSRSDKSPDSKIISILEMSATEIEFYCDGAVKKTNYGGGSINDGSWHLVGVSWNKNSGTVSLSLDGATKTTSPEITGSCVGKALSKL